MRLPQREVFVPAPAGAAVMAVSFYTHAGSAALKSLHWQLTRSDTVDVAFVRASTDQGRTWTKPREIVTGQERAEGVFRRHLHPGYLDPGSGKLLMLRTEGVLCNDDPLRDGIRNWRLHCAVSSDGGQSYDWDEPIIEEGAEYSAAHPVAGQWVGKNALMIGAISCVPLTLQDGTLLVPCQMVPLGEDGEPWNPGGGYSYKEALVIRGTWQGDGRLSWQTSQRVKPDPTRTTRGLIEPTVAELEDGRVLMVMRGSNDVQPELPGTKWHVFSDNSGQTWSTPAPWTYDDGEAFYSPSSCSQLLRHSNGKLFWIGNIAPQNPRGNAPRFPLVIGEVHQSSGLLLRATITVIDTRLENESERLQLSNFYAREDRESGKIVLHCTRLFAGQQPDTPLDWTADAMIYQIPIG